MTCQLIRTAKQLHTALLV